MALNSNTQANFDTVVKNLSDNFKAAPMNQKLITNIKTIGRKAMTTLDDFENLKKNAVYDKYNMTYSRIAAYQNAVKIAKKKHLSQDGLTDTFKQYQQNQLDKDNEYLTQVYNQIAELSKQGYQAIMQLRELFTGQRVIYAIEHINKNISYQQFLSEEQYLELFIGQRSRGYNSLKKVTQPFGFAIGIDTKSLMSDSIHSFGLDITHSQDWAYQRLAKMMENQTSTDHVISNHERWEIYTEMKSYFHNRKQPPSDKEFNQYLNDFLETKNAWLTRLTTQGNIASSQHNAVFQIDRLAFYRGGDSSYNKKIVIQNKSTNAITRVGTIYNGLKTIKSVFGKFFNSSSNSQILLDAEKIQTLFTATFQDLPNQIINAGFAKANDYAQQQIKKRVAHINNTLSRT